MRCPAALILFLSVVIMLLFCWDAHCARCRCQWMCRSEKCNNNSVCETCYCLCAVRHVCPSLCEKRPVCYSSVLDTGEAHLVKVKDPVMEIQSWLHESLKDFTRGICQTWVDFLFCKNKCWGEFGKIAVSFSFEANQSWVVFLPSAESKRVLPWKTAWRVSAGPNWLPWQQVTD